jgi:hypothetical protein
MLQNVHGSYITKYTRRIELLIFAASLSQQGVCNTFMSVGVQMKKASPHTWCYLVTTLSKTNHMWLLARSQEDICITFTSYRVRTAYYDMILPMQHQSCVVACLVTAKRMHHLHVGWHQGERSLASSVLHYDLVMTTLFNADHA